MSRRVEQALNSKKILVLASGRGSDFQAIVDHQTLGILQNVEIGALVSNHEAAPVIRRAKQSKVDSFMIEGVTGKHFASSSEREEARKSFDRKCLEIVRDLNIDFIVLAGFDQIVTREFVDSCKFRILNIHPAYDLEKYGGRNMVGNKVHELVLNSHARFSGCAVHYVTNEVDMGPVLLKKRAAILPDDSPATLERRILELEHKAYPEAIQLVVDGRVIIDESSRRCFVDRYSHGWDIDWESRQQLYVERKERTEVREKE